MYLFAKQAEYVQPEKAIQEDCLEEPIITCRNCRCHVTDPGCQAQRDSSFCHTFANPQGQVFEIGCFNAAIGCIDIPPAFLEFSWFRGYHWNIGICRDCTTHLGWFFCSDRDQFFGLILDKLVFP